MPSVSGVAPRLPASAKPRRLRSLIFGSVRFQQCSIRTLQPREGAPDEALGQDVLRAADFKDQFDNRRRAASVVLQCQDWLCPGTVALEQHRPKRIQQGRFPKLVRPNDQIEAIAELAQLRRHGEALELVD